MAELLGALLIGVAGGIAGGLLGLGGGTLYVPALVLLLGVAQRSAQGLSLIAIVPTAISATITNARAGYVDAPAVRWVTPLALLAAAAGGALAGVIDEALLTRLFGTLLVFVSGRLLLAEWREARAR